MKLRHAFLPLIAVALVAAGCGSDNDDDGGKKGDAKKGDAKKGETKQSAAVEKDRDNKTKQVKEARKAFDKSPKDVGACRNLAMAYVALASPASTANATDEPAPLPKDRDKNLEKSVDTLENCVDLNRNDRDVQQMLASTYMATNKYDKATPLLQQLARTARGPERANAYYAWGLAASNAQEYQDAITAWRQFLAFAPKTDPRIPQVRQSIKALAQAAKNPAPAAAPAGDDQKGDPNPDDKGGSDAPEDGGSDEDKGEDDKGGDEN